MEKKPVNIVVKDSREAARRLNKIVENGGAIFDVGVNQEYVTHITKNSDGSTKEEKEKVYRIIGFVETCVGNELDSLKAVREELHECKKEREEMDRTLKVMNKSAFAPLSIFLLGIGLFTFVFGLLTLIKVLPLDDSQRFISIILTIVGVLALAGSITAFILRRKKKLSLLARKEEILKQDDDLKRKEQEIDSRVPQWYKNAIWSYEGDVVKNFTTRLTIK